MATKTISIMDDVYELLARNKRENESFSDVIRRTLKNKEDIMQFKGAWGDLSDTEITQRKQLIDKLRKDSSKNTLTRVKLIQ